MDDVNENDFVDPTTTPNENDEYSASSKILDGEKMLEVTRKLFRSTERDPDRDLRKQVLLKTALRNLPHFVHYQQYTEINNQQHQYNNININNNNNNNNDTNPMQQYNNHLQPNAIEVSTTSMRMLDLNDDYDQRDDLQQEQELVDKRQPQQQQQSSTLQSHLDDTDENEISSHFEQQQNTVNQFDDILFNRHNSFDNLYQPNELNESNEEATINNINWNNIGYKIFEFPSIDTVSKVSKFLEDEFHDEEEQQPTQTEEQDKIDEKQPFSKEPTLNQQQSSTVLESSPSSSSTDESLISDTSNGEVVDDKEEEDEEEQEEVEDKSKKNDSGNTLTNSFYPVSSSPRSYKRRSSRDYEDSMDIDLARASKLFETSPFGQFKRLRKNFENQSAPLIETTTGGF